MDWALAIGRQTGALRRILAALVAMAAGNAPTLPRHLHRAVLRVLRPAEAAARRLVIALAHTLPLLPGKAPALSRAASATKTPAILKSGVGTGILMPARPAVRRPLQRLALPLFDRLRRRPAGEKPRRDEAPAGVPRISVPGHGGLPSIPLRGRPSPNDPLCAARLNLRLRALAAVLDDLPAAAGRFARWQVRLARDRRGADGSKKAFRAWPLKPGRPPGWRKKPVHEVHEALAETHWLALTALERRDTS